MWNTCMRNNTHLPWGRIALSSAYSSSHSATYSLSTVKQRTVFLASCWSISRGIEHFSSIGIFSVLLLENKSADWRIWLVQFRINLSWISTCGGIQWTSMSCLSLSILEQKMKISSSYHWPWWIFNGTSHWNTNEWISLLKCHYNFTPL